jgi:hypothetical protein
MLTVGTELGHWALDKGQAHWAGHWARDMGYEKLDAGHLDTGQGTDHCARGIGY